jgi:hypothetical protein
MKKAVISIVLATLCLSILLRRGVRHLTPTAKATALANSTGLPASGQPGLRRRRWRRARRMTMRREDRRAYRWHRRRFIMRHRRH